MAAADDLSATFKKCCNVGVSGKQTQKTTLTTKNMTKWFKDAKIYGKSLTATDTDIAFSKVKTKGVNEITLAQLEELLKLIAKKYMADHKLASEEDAVKEMKEKLKVGIDAAKGTTKTSATGNVAKMTDTKQYTGSHAQRFDAEGKGKGKEGREDIADNSGYVGNYKDEGTYDKKHPAKK